MYAVIRKTILGLLILYVVQVKSQYAHMQKILLISKHKLEVTAIRITGNKKTSDRYILRELPFTLYDSLPVKNIDSLATIAKNQLINTRLFLTVELTSRIVEQSLVIEIFVSERNFFFPSLIFELADDDFDTWWRQQMRDPERINYGAAVSLRNMTGYNDRLSASFSVGFRQNFEISYTHPAIDKKQRIGIAAEYKHSYSREIGYSLMMNNFSILKDNDFISFSRKAMLAFSYRKSLFVRHTFYVSHNSVQVADTILKLNPVYLNGTAGRSTYSDIAYRFSLVRVNNFSYPLRGHYVSLRLSKAGLLKRDDINMTSVDIDVRYFYPFAREKTFASIALEAYCASGGNNQLPFIKQAELGKQTNHIRGFQFYRLLGSGIVIVKKEIKWQALNKTIKLNFMPEKFRVVNFQLYPKFFMDAGSIYNQTPGNNNLLNRWLISYGTGIDLVSYYDTVVSTEFVAGPLLPLRFYISLRTVTF